MKQVKISSASLNDYSYLLFLKFVARSSIHDLPGLYICFLCCSFLGSQLVYIFASLDDGNSCKPIISSCKFITSCKAETHSASSMTLQIIWRTGLSHQSQFYFTRRTGLSQQSYFMFHITTVGSNIFVILMCIFQMQGEV